MFKRTTVQVNIIKNYLIVQLTLARAEAAKALTLQKMALFSSTEASAEIEPREG